MSAWKRISSEIAYQSSYFNVRDDQVIEPDGKKGIYHVVDVVGAVAIVALDDKNKIYLIHEEKYIPGKILTIPAGKITNGENPLFAAKRELKEEAGLTAEEWIYLGKFLDAPGHSNGIGHCFLAQDLKEGKQKLESSEVIEVIKVPFEKAVKMIKKGEIIDAWAIIPIFKAKLHLAKNCKHPVFTR